jgi:hypothetical protein
VLLETLLPRVVLMAPRPSRLRVQIVIADVSAATLDLRNALAAQGHDVTGHDLLIVPTTDECSRLRAYKHVSAILFIVGGEESQLVRCGTSPLRYDQAMLVVVQIGPAGLYAHFKIVFLAASAILELALVGLVVRRGAVHAADELRAKFLHLLISLRLARAFDVYLEVRLGVARAWPNSSWIGLQASHI